MSAVLDQSSLKAVSRLLAVIVDKGVRLWAEHGQLRYRASPGVLDADDVAALRACKQQIVALLEHDLRGAGSALAPLAFSQLAHWNYFRLSSRPAIRQVAAAMTLSGPLDAQALERSLTELVRRHEALRTRVVLCDERPLQLIDAPTERKLETIDLSETPQHERQARIQRHIAELILEPIDVAAGPLLGVRLLRIGEAEHVLVLAMEHMIADGASLDVFVQDLLDGYAQAAVRGDCRVATASVQLADHAIWQRSMHHAWCERHRAHWEGHLRGATRLSFPMQHSTLTGWGASPVRIGGALRGELGQWVRARRTTIVLTLLSVFAALGLRWCSQADAVIRYIIDGRSNPSAARSIGFFAFALYLRVTLRESDTFATLLERVTAEYCHAHEHADHALLAAQMPPPQFTRAPAFNWSPRRTSASSECMGIECAAFPFTHPMREVMEVDGEPGLQLYESAQHITGELWFPLQRFSRASIDGFACNFVSLTERCIREPDRRLLAFELAA